MESCIYPTYKSARPIAEATQNFLKWYTFRTIDARTHLMTFVRLSAQPEGPVILLSHSMGGLLAAEAATASTLQSKRIIGLVNFDVPFLGMHPHVVISGIESLLPKNEGDQMKTEKEVNDPSQVKIVHSGSIDDEWESFKATFSSMSTSYSIAY